MKSLWSLLKHVRCWLRILVAEHGAVRMNRNAKDYRYDMCHTRYSSFFHNPKFCPPCDLLTIALWCSSRSLHEWHVRLLDRYCPTWIHAYQIKGKLLSCMTDASTGPLLSYCLSAPPLPIFMANISEDNEWWSCLALSPSVPTCLVSASYFITSHISAFFESDVSFPSPTCDI